MCSTATLTAAGCSSLADTAAAASCLIGASGICTLRVGGPPHICSLSNKGSKHDVSRAATRRKDGRCRKMMFIDASEAHLGPRCEDDLLEECGCSMTTAT